MTTNTTPATLKNDPGAVIAEVTARYLPVSTGPSDKGAGH